MFEQDLAHNAARAPELEDVFGVQLARDQCPEEALVVPVVVVRGVEPLGDPLQPLPLIEVHRQGVSTGKPQIPSVRGRASLPRRT